MNWQDFIFGKKALQSAAQTGQQGPSSQPQQGQGNAGLDIGKMAQDQANKMKVTAMGGPVGQHQPVGAPQPTMQQLCPMCGK